MQLKKTKLIWNTQPFKHFPSSWRNSKPFREEQLGPMN